MNQGITGGVNEMEEIKNLAAAEKEEEKITKKSSNNNRQAIKANRISFSTHDGHALTPAESLFIDEYIKTNGRQAVLKAYPNRNPNGAAQYAQELLNRPYITSEINYRLAQSRDAAIADAKEIMQYFTDVMRGKINDQFGLEASLGERTKAAQELAKRTIDIENRLAGKEQPPEVKITLDWARPTEVAKVEVK